MSQLIHIPAPDELRQGTATPTSSPVLDAWSPSPDRSPSRRTARWSVWAIRRRRPGRSSRTSAAAWRRRGASFADVIKLTYFLTDVAHMPVVRAVRDQYLDAAALPASSAVAVAALVRPEFLLEVEALALVAA